jgi:2-aminoadipate transaminase
MDTSKSNAFSKKAQRTKDPPISWLMKLALARPHLISLAAGFTDSPSLPAAEVHEILQELWKEPRNALSALQYGNTAGDEPLREWTRARLEKRDRLDGTLSNDQVVIGNGSQQLLSLIAEILCDPGDIILIEDPTYFVFLGIVESCGLEAVPFAGAQELRQRLAQLKSEGKISRVKLAYFVSYFRNPTGTSLTSSDRKEIGSILKEFEETHPIYILEDAAYRDLRFAGDDVPSFMAQDPKLERTIYTATYTKPFATGLKVGFAVAPPSLVAPILRFKGNEDFGTSHFDQHILRRAVVSGRYEKHLEQIAEVYRKKSGAMEESLKEHFPKEAKWSTPSGGLYFWVSLPAQTDCGMESEIFKKSLDAEVFYVPGQLCYCESTLRKRPRHQMRLSFGSASIDQIREGIKRLGSVLKKEI